MKSIHDLAFRYLSILMLLSVSLFGQLWTLVDSFVIPSDYVKGIEFDRNNSNLWIEDGHSIGSIGCYAFDPMLDTLTIHRAETLSHMCWDIVVYGSVIFVNHEYGHLISKLSFSDLSLIETIDLSAAFESSSDGIRGMDYDGHRWAFIATYGTYPTKIVILDSSFSLIGMSPFFDRDGRNSMTGIFIEDSLLWVSAHNGPLLNNGAIYVIDPETWVTRQIYDIPLYVPEGITKAGDYYFISQFRHTGPMLYQFQFFDTTTGITEIELPISLVLDAHPNPFNSSCRITVEQTFLSVQNQTGMSDLPTVDIFDIAGQLVAEIPVGEGPCALPPRGDAKNGTTREIIWQPDEKIGSGVYLVRARVDDGQTAIEKVVYLK